MITKVLQVVGTMDCGGVETYLMNVFRAINREKFNFLFLCYGYDKFDYEDEIENLGGKIIRVPDVRESGILKHILYLKKIIAENDISVVHAHIYYGSVFSLLAAKLRGVRLRIVHSHATSPEPKPTLVKRFCFLGASIGIELLANRFMACGRNAGKTLYMPWRAFRVLPNGIDLKSFCYNENSRQGVRRELGIDENSTVLMHTGRFAEVKNHTFLIDIFAEYQSIVPDSQLILIGVGPLKAGIEAKVERLHLSDKVKFVGLRSDVNRICSAADIFLFPSLFEGFPVALIEAQANGLTCLVSDTIDTGIRLTERVEFYSLSKGAKAWAHRISELDRERGGVRQGLVGSAYDISANIGEIEKMYEGGE